MRPRPVGVDLAFVRTQAGELRIEVTNAEASRLRH